ncbi:MAG: penicillin acylase family protein [Ferruginibacter sp.]
MKKMLAGFIFFTAVASAQINPAKVTIARDSFGVPHIFAATDPEVAYGLAWAHAEDDFNTLQLVILSGKAKLGTALGRKGAEADYVVNLLRCRQLVDEQWHTLNPDFIALIKGYVQGLNDFAKAHRQKIKNKNAFPFNEKEYLTATVFSLSIFSGVDKVLPKILGGTIGVIPGFSSQGSNAFAFHSSKTTTGEAFLAINAHQPLEGPTAFYEAHLQSEQGWNMLGGLFPGGCLIFHGTNENLGWAHTVNNPDRIDVYQLEMNPANNNLYKFDGQWLPLEVKKARLNVKGIPVALNRNVYWSKYGATVKSKQGVFALRLPANMDCKAMEQWYRMNKAKNFTEFYNALAMTSLPMFNIVYADKYDTIFYISNAKVPVRNSGPQYNWQGTLPGNTSATLWTQFKPVTALPQYINPGAGYLFNTNHSPFLATDPKFNLASNKFDKNDGFEKYINNRSQRFTELIKGVDKIDYDYLKRIKFDTQYPRQLEFAYGIDSLLLLNAEEYPALKEVINNLQQWDYKAIKTSKGAAVFLLLFDYFSQKLSGSKSRKIGKIEGVEAFQYANDYMIKHFGTVDLKLGDIQKLVRGNDARPADGLPDVLVAAYTIPYQKGLRKITTGDAYVCFVRYPKNGLPVIESINTFGASQDPLSPHYKDQMQMFQNQQLKQMTLDKNKVFQTAERIYHPSVK